MTRCVNLTHTNLIYGLMSILIILQLNMESFLSDTTIFRWTKIIIIYIERTASENSNPMWRVYFIIIFILISSGNSEQTQSFFVQVVDPNFNKEKLYF